MNGPQRVELQDPAEKPRFSRARTAKKIAIGVLAIFIVVVMITWFGFIGWGVVASLQWLMDVVKNLWPG